MESKKIVDIKSLKARNLLRGMIGQDDPTAIMRNINKIRKICSAVDYQIAVEVLRENAVFKKNTLNGDFIRECPRIITDGLLYPVKDIVEKLNKNHVKLFELTSLYICITKSVLNGKFEEALFRIPEIIDKRGVSCFLIRILYFIKNHVQPRSTEMISADGYLRKIRVDKTKYLPRVIKELSNPRTDYFAICKKIRRIKKETQLGIISHTFVDHVPRTENEFLSCLSAYYSFSLLDAFFYLNCINRIGVSFTEESNHLDKELCCKFNELNEIEFDPNYFYELDPGNADANFFRETFLLIENEKAFRYKTIHGALYNESEQSSEERYPHERFLLKDYFGNVEKLHDLTRNDGASGIHLERFISGSSCFLENTSALLYYIEKRDADLRNEEVEFVETMSFTKDIGVTCPIHYLNKMKENASSDEFKLVVTCLRSIKDKGQIAEHELRKAIQDVTIAHHNSNLISLLDYLYNISPAVTEHLIYLCDEMLLSKMFQITKIPNQAIWIRAMMLEWYGEKTDDSSFKERAKNLKIDVQISREKGTIDDSRIYVDPVKFTQWLNDNVVNNATILLDEIVASAEVRVFNLKWESLASSLSSYDQLAALLLNAYAEFCNNKYFGIASYLGRRIRHGTFKGTGMKEVKEINKSEKYSSLFEVQEFSEYYDGWLAAYEQSFDRLTADYLHIKSTNKPDGMIACDITTSSKKTIANHMIRDVVDSYIRNENSLEIPYIVTDYCWRLAEEDLIVVRKHLMSIKSKWAVFRFDSLSDENLKNRGVQDFCQELNAITAERFRTISSWFTKPSIASPTADLTLLFRAVVSEIKSFFIDFDPDVSYEGSDMVITGGAYFVIYDALFILIFNAAKYGDPKGKLLFVITYDSDMPNKRITISISSNIRIDDKVENVKSAIEDAVSGDYEDAHLIEGRSGIKKLKRMEHDKCIYNVSFDYLPRSVSASFDFAVDY